MSELNHVLKLNFSGVLDLNKELFEKLNTLIFVVVAVGKVYRVMIEHGQQQGGFLFRSQLNFVCRVRPIFLQH